MPSRIESDVLPPIAGAKPRASRSDFFDRDARANERGFADTLDRARSSQPESEPVEHPQTRKPATRKSKATDTEAPAAEQDPPLDATNRQPQTVSEDVDSSEVDFTSEIDSSADEEPSPQKASDDGTGAFIFVAEQAGPAAGQPVPTSLPAAQDAETVGEREQISDAPAISLPTRLTQRPAVGTATVQPGETPESDEPAEPVASDSDLQDLLATLGLSEADDGSSIDAPDIGEQSPGSQATGNAHAARPVQPLSTSKANAAAENLPAAAAGEERSADRPEEAGTIADVSDSLELPGSAVEQLSPESHGKSSPPASPSFQTPEINASLDTPKPAVPHVRQPVAPQAPAQPSPPDFAAVNHEKIVTSVRSELLPRGGAMEIRLDPPELGALQVSVRMENGIMSASFQTSSDEATRLLSHSLGQLKHVLESAGVTVDKLQVQQSPKSDHEANANDQRNGSSHDDASARQEQQRKEMIRRMWRKLAGTSDPLDLVA